MIVRTLDAQRDPFRPKKDEEEILEPEVLYLSAIEALLYLAQCTRPDISFAVNLLARYSNAPTHMHWNGVKDIFRYLKDARYLSESHRARSQKGYVITVGDTAISWRSTKQTLATTSSNHVEIFALHEASHNAACIEQLKKGYIKGDNTKHIAPKFFYSHQQQ
ncbi:secreted RxLR effector protein 161-like [Pyrus communis]|uniref:secreted RxLR effector protein 161-like n=1 Tax=Pyrus communis TaxID=23211 RepID=UPI0035C10F98